MLCEAIDQEAGGIGCQARLRGSTLSIYETQGEVSARPSVWAWRRTLRAVMEQYEQEKPLTYVGALGTQIRVHSQHGQVSQANEHLVRQRG